MNDLFTNDPEWNKSATIGWQTREKALWGVKDGYKNAANDLVKIALKKGRQNDIHTLDTYIFPVMFLYRQSLEVSLKLILLQCFGKKPILKNGHSLSELWKLVNEDVIIGIIENKKFHEVVKTYKKKFYKLSTEGIDFSYIEKLLLDIMENDKNSDVWRYLINRKGDLYFNGQKYINYCDIKTRFNKVYDYFDYIYDCCCEYLSD